MYISIEKYSIIMNKVVGLLLMLFLAGSVQGQKSAEDYKDWHLKDLKADGIPGVSVEKTYSQLLAGKQSNATVVVAVIDSGIDIAHEDLKDVIWTNADEIPGNGIDDDNNGYVDDVHGWNFIGGRDGSMVGNDNLEVARLYKKYHTKFKDVKASELKGDMLNEWKMYQKVKNEFEEKRTNALKGKEQYENVLNMYNQSKEILLKHLDKDELDQKDLEGIETEDQKVIAAKEFLGGMFAQGFREKDLDQWGNHVKKQANWYYNPDIDVRRDIIKDDPNNLYEKGYGNNKVEGVDNFHGTFVAGIIAAKRNNGIGIDGVADNVIIMPVRTVPGGDEHDKDVANAIRYAVDNGARVINMSFGKSFSPHEAVVAQAIQYAENNDVLLVHAAGNDGKNLDTGDNYPTNYSDFIRGKVKTYLTIGASSINNDEKLPAGFSNYGDKKVDLFAPGVNVYSSEPDNHYGTSNGTSFAAPIVSGVAALIMSYYPDLSAKKVKKILEKTVVEFDGKKVHKPGSGGYDDEGNELKPEVVEFADLSKTDGIVNAYEAMVLAAKKSKYKLRSRISN